MARKTDGEKVDELERLVAALTERANNPAAEIDAIHAADTDHARSHADLRRESEREIALLRREVEDLKKDRERWGQRLWMVLAPFAAGAAGILLSNQLGLKR